MIENIRKFRIIIILGLSLVALGLVLGIKDDLFRGGAGGQGVLRINGRTYYEKEFQLLGTGAQELVMGLAGAGDFGLFMYAQALAGDQTDRQANAERFFTNRILLRKAAQELGIQPSDDAIATHIRSMRAFADGDKGFSEQNYRNFIERSIGRLGMTENDFRALIADYLAFERIREITGPGLTENRDATRHQTALESQQISGELASLNIDAFEQSVQPTEEQLKEYWETMKDSFTTEEKRKFSYVIVTPQMPAPEEEKPLPDNASEEDKKKREEEKSKKAAALAQAKREKQIETDRLVDDFSYQLEEQNGSGFEELVRKFGWETRTADLFPKSQPPKALDVALRASSRGGRLAEELFRISMTDDPLSRISPPIAIGENEWILARLDEVEKAREKTFEEAKDEARLNLVKEKAAEAMKQKAKESVESIRKALADGKSFAEAAKAAGLSGVKTVEKINPGHQPADGEPRTLFEAGRFVTPGELADVIEEEDRVFILLITKREVVKEADPVAALDGQVKNSAIRNQYVTFNDWLSARADMAKIERLYGN